MSDKSKRKSRKRDRTPIPALEQQLQTILDRLNTLEGSCRSSSVIEGGTTTPSTRPVQDDPHAALTVSPSEVMGPPPIALAVPSSAVPCDASIDLSVPCSSGTLAGTDMVIKEVTEKLVSAISAIPVRSKHLFISNFDPSLHDFDSWCSEVDHVKHINTWDDRECLARVGNCLIGDAKLWLNEWVSNDRSWSNFKREFKALCPRRLDVANILFDVMKTDSDNYPTYAEYARRSLLRLRIVNGMSDELIAAIVIRGISDVRIQAAATNAKLLPDDLVNFLSIYVKPTQLAPVRPRGILHMTGSQKRENSDSRIKCFFCGILGHKQISCAKRAKSDRLSADTFSIGDMNSNKQLPQNDLCSFCKKMGHKVEDCFTKQRAVSRQV